MVMHNNFIQRVMERIKQSEEARAELLRRAEAARQRGDMEAYWSLASPSNLGDLWWIAGDEGRARSYYEQFADYYRSRHA